MKPGSAAIILAAGRSSRMGRPKQLMMIGGETLVGRAARSAREAGCDAIVVVTGAFRGRVRRALAGSGVLVVHNPRWRSGLASSICAGLRAVGAAPEVFLLLADQPFVNAAVLRRLAESRTDSGETAAASRYGGVLGAPALFGREWIADLLRLTGDRGAGGLLARHRSRVAVVDFPEGLCDLDTPGDTAVWLPRVLDQSDVAGLAVHSGIDDRSSIGRHGKPGPALLG